VTGPALDARAYAAALAALPGMGPVGLAALLRGRDPEAAWRLVLEGAEQRPGRPVERSRSSHDAGPRLPWDVVASSVDVAGRWESFQSAGIRVTYLGRPDYPAALIGDPLPPAVLFWRGDLAVLDRVCVAIVGTRRCTSYGLDVARRMASDLARAGLAVVSGLALGIDGAAHTGALEALGPTTVGVAASGVDVVYPPRHARLWAEVVERGAVVSETAPGQSAQSWRFPARNRILAGLSRAVVVVEAHVGGGTMHTVEAAADRGVDVLAVPGPVTSPASAGTNQLLRDGRPPVRDFRDVLDELGDFRALTAGQSPLAGIAPPAVRLDGNARQVIAAIDWTPTATATIAERAGLPLRLLSATLVRLEAMGMIRGEGGWWERAKCS
jgi:DNA processing protein